MNLRFSTLAVAILSLLIIAIWSAETSLGISTAQQKNKAMEVKIMTLDPGHFHAGLVQKEMYPDVSPRVHVYAPLGFDLYEHLKRIASFNNRKDNPTRWEMEIHAGGDPLARMLAERPGNVVTMAGRNQGKIDRIKASVGGGLNVLVDKPWIINASDFPKLEATFKAAEAKKVIAYDIMTERSEITTVLQKELLHAPDVFGQIQKGSESDPAVYIESIHHILKVVAGAPNIRPAWFFDVKQQGEGVADVGTHLVDLIQWMLFPEQIIDYRKDINVISGKRWPTVVSLPEFSRVTNEKAFPDYLTANVKDGKLDYYCNGAMTYALRGVHAKLDVIWNYEAPAGGGDTHVAIFKGTKSTLEIRQGKEENWKPELYVVPNSASSKAEILAALKKKVAALQSKFAGVGVEERGNKLWVTIPDKFRDGHEAHFAEVMRRFLSYLRDPKALPAWENPNMLAKYYTTTKGLEMGYRTTTASK
ncbi:MAG TPA: putative oxidoreductase C-terminal domain-containing protein [Blastocatellia bacterium]|nr:putative oxidoreductase C-terminal domain-containing protein [Blastocatellia bacterium]